MPKVSVRGKEIAHSPIRSLVPFARKAKEKGSRVLHLNIGQPDILTPEAAVEALRNYHEPIISYGASEGSYSLRKTVCSYYNEAVAPLEIEHVYVTTGASEAIMFTLFSCFDQDEEILIPEPFYANYIGFAQVCGVNLVPVPSYIESGFDLPSPEKITERITSKTKAIFLCNPGNPTGNLYSEQELRKLAQIVLNYDLFLIVDEVYREFCYDQEFFSVLKIQELAQHVIVLDSISKIFSACGARVGFIVSKNTELLSSVLKFAQLRLCPPMIGQVVANACYKERREYLNGVRQEYNQRRLYLHKRLSSIPGVKCYLPKAAFYIMTELPVDSSDKFCQWLLSDFSYQGNTLMLAPGSGFYLDAERGQKQVRIAFILNIDQLAIAMDCLQKALEIYPGRTAEINSKIHSQIASI